MWVQLAACVPDAAASLPAQLFQLPEHTEAHTVKAIAQIKGATECQLVHSSSRCTEHQTRHLAAGSHVSEQQRFMHHQVRLAVKMPLERHNRTETGTLKPGDKQKMVTILSREA